MVRHELYPRRSIGLMPHETDSEAPAVGDINMADMLQRLSAILEHNSAVADTRHGKLLNMFSDLFEAVRAHDAHFASLSEHINAIDTRCISVADATRQTVACLSVLDTTISDVSTRVRDLHDRVCSLSERVGSLGDRVGTLGDRVADLAAYIRPCPSSNSPATIRTLVTGNDPEATPTCFPHQSYVLPPTTPSPQRLRSNAILQNINVALDNNSICRNLQQNGQLQSEPRVTNMPMLGVNFTRQGLESPRSNRSPLKRASPNRNIIDIKKSQTRTGQINRLQTHIRPPSASRTASPKVVSLIPKAKSVPPKPHQTPMPTRNQTGKRQSLPRGFRIPQQVYRVPPKHNRQNGQAGVQPRSECDPSHRTSPASRPGDCVVIELEDEDDHGQASSRPSQQLTSAIQRSPEQRAEGQAAALQHCSEVVDMAPVTKVQVQEIVEVECMQKQQIPVQPRHAQLKPGATNAGKRVDVDLKLDLTGRGEVNGNSPPQRRRLPQKRSRSPPTSESSDENFVVCASDASASEASSEDLEERKPYPRRVRRTRASRSAALAARRRGEKQAAQQKNKRPCPAVSGQNGNAKRLIDRADELRSRLFHEDGPDPREPFNIYMAAASKGSATAVCRAADMLRAGAVGVSPTSKRLEPKPLDALNLVTDVLESTPDCTEALNVLGDIWMEGACGRPKKKKALELFTRSAELGDVGGIYRKGAWYFDAMTTASAASRKTRHCKKAVELLKQGIDGGCGLSASMLGHLYEIAGRSQVIRNVLIEDGNDTDLDRIVVGLYKKAMELGAGVGYNNMAACYEVGYGGLEANFEMARDYYKIAFMKGHAPAADNLALLLELGGRGKFRDHINTQEAVKWYKLGHRARSPTATYHLGNTYEVGVNAPMNKRAAESLYLEAIQFAHDSDADSGVIRDAEADLFGLYATRLLLDDGERSEWEGKMHRHYGRQHGNSKLAVIRGDLALVVGPLEGWKNCVSEPCGKELELARERLDNSLLHENFTALSRRVSSLRNDVVRALQEGDKQEVIGKGAQLIRLVGEENVAHLGLNVEQCRGMTQ